METETEKLTEKLTEFMNFQFYKDSHEDYIKFKKKLCKFIFDNMPREELIKGLKKRKIIKQDWNEKGETYKLT